MWQYFSILDPPIWRVGRCLRKDACFSGNVIFVYDFILTRFKTIYYILAFSDKNQIDNWIVVPGREKFAKISAMF